MKSIRKMLAGTLLSGAAALGAATGFSVANAADTAVADTAAATPPPPAGPRGPERIYSKLGLTAEQRAQIETLFAAAKPQMQSLHEQMRAAHLKLRAQVSALLTPAQKAQLATLEAERAANPHHGHWEDTQR